MGEILKTVVKRGKSVRYGNSTAVQVLFCGHEFYVEGRKTLQDMQGFGFQGWIQAGDGIGEPDEFAAEVNAFKESGKDAAFGDNAGENDAVGFSRSLTDGGYLKGGICAFVVDRVRFGCFFDSVHQFIHPGIFINFAIQLVIGFPDSNRVFGGDIAVKIV